MSFRLTYLLYVLLLSMPSTAIGQQAPGIAGPRAAKFREQADGVVRSLIEKKGGGVRKCRCISPN